MQSIHPWEMGGFFKFIIIHLLLAHHGIDDVTQRLELGVLDQLELVDEVDEVAEARVHVRLGAQRHHLKKRTKGEWQIK